MTATLKWTYWISTGLLGALMLLSGFMYLTAEQMAEAFRHLGFPAYFRIELGVAKILAGVVLVAPVMARVKEWAYVGLAISFLSAILAHIASGDPAAAAVTPAVIFGLLAVSYISHHRRLAALGAR